MPAAHQRLARWRVDVQTFAARAPLQRARAFWVPLIFGSVMTLIFGNHLHEILGISEEQDFLLTFCIFTLIGIWLPAEKSIARGFANVWQKGPEFAKHWQIWKTTRLRRFAKHWQIAAQTAILALLLALPFLIALSAAGEWLAGLFGASTQQPVLQQFGTLPRGEKILFAIAACLLAPIVEEYFFRGVAFPFFVRRTGAVSGFLLTATLFAAFHFHLASFPALFVFSFFACAVYAKTESMLAPVLMHALYNAVALALALSPAGA